MPAESVTQRLGHTQLDRVSERQLRAIVAAQTDAIQNLATKLDTLTAKLNADAGVTDTNYATDFATTTAAIITD
jgi:hypothetical protein